MVCVDNRFELQYHLKLPFQSIICITFIFVFKCSEEKYVCMHVCKQTNKQPANQDC